MKEDRENSTEKDNKAYLQLYAGRMNLYESKAPRTESLFLFIFEV